LACERLNGLQKNTNLPGAPPAQISLSGATRAEVAMRQYSRVYLLLHSPRFLLGAVIGAGVTLLLVTSYHPLVGVSGFRWERVVCRLFVRSWQAC
jgi:hypothetical protein